MDKIEAAAEAATIALLAKAENAESGEAAEQFSSAANGTMAVLTLAVHNKGDAARRADPNGRLLN